MSNNIHVQLSPNKRVDLTNLDIDDITITGIANALSKLCRYGGRIEEFYSVAQHSILVSNELAKYENSDLTLCGLLHDASEAYLGEVVAPLKDKLSFYKELEHIIQEKVYQKYGLCETYNKFRGLIKSYDLQIRGQEMKYFYLGCTSYDWRPVNPNVAEGQFLSHFCRCVKEPK